MKEIRTLGFYQPFCSLMLHGKKETRWVRKGRKPPFPLGEYLFYSTKKKADNDTLLEWCGKEIMQSIRDVLWEDDTMYWNGYALATATLVNVRRMTKEDEPMAFVKFMGERTVKDKNNNDVVQVQWVLEFNNVTALRPFIFMEGKQGVGKFMLNKEQEDKRSVARKDASKEADGSIKKEGKETPPEPEPILKSISKDA